MDKLQSTLIFFVNGKKVILKNVYLTCMLIFVICRATVL
jgi:hypothetical protein